MPTFYTQNGDASQPERAGAALWLVFHRYLAARLVYPILSRIALVVFGVVLDRVERGVVVHLELEIKLDPAATCEDFDPEFVKAAGEVAALFEEDSVAGAVAVRVALRRVWTGDLVRGMEELEGEDGETVDHQAGGFRVERRARVGEPAGFEILHEEKVATFSEVISLLVHQVDVVFAQDDFVVGRIGRASIVFSVPEIEICEVLAGYYSSEFGGCRTVFD